MAKTRVTFTIDPADAERLRRAAERAGVTVSAYIEARVLASVEQDEAIRETFRDADAATNAAYAAADAAIWPEPEPMTAEEKAEADAVLERFFGKMQRSA
ncbi:ribbon-helix-helix domain-containing protein [Streptomyces lunaelactis]|uniref:ribbon-helix-helix domain-containing protein n=1 Tax=Streptomyces lunaelactis TaxID=1535768 RepID=UPI001584E3BA|nr:ribbon-helix-helix domain-containing protein [Streptomyces lunaelactis]NUK36761.1 ribbon-helix-helix domain-containing protein [Streptomyces lunaelactis]NUK44705.1 ribbon-helix-helix domain-containing protein [Streptomyces lunaelactis]NUK94050.1 ribbon-helix-helix domain-containing protein [Streptomyces lunaelactis]NUL32154.1 ribbon-helix-helix domain-containing protein [Streptomyces lunaelactis]